MTRKTVFIVDDDPVIRDSLSFLMDSASIEHLCFASAENFLAAAPLDECGCLLLDVTMPGMTGPELQESLVERGISLPIIFLTGHGDIPTTVRAIKLGAHDFLTKPVNGTVLLEKIRDVFEQNSSRTPDAQEAALRRRLSILTDREYGIMLLALNGLGNKEIAQQLAISHRTVEIHRSHVLLKTETRSFLELANALSKSGIQLEARHP